MVLKILFASFNDERVYRAPCIGILDVSCSLKHFLTSCPGIEFQKYTVLAESFFLKQHTFVCTRISFLSSSPTDRYWAWPVDVPFTYLDTASSLSPCVLIFAFMVRFQISTWGTGRGDTFYKLSIWLVHSLWFSANSLAFANQCVDYLSYSDVGLIKKTLVLFVH